MNNSRKSLLKAFSVAAFDPRKPGTLSTIVEVNDQGYLIKRGQEMLREAERFEGIERWAKLRDAVGVLGYAMTLTDAVDGPVPSSAVSDCNSPEACHVCKHRRSHHNVFAVCTWPGCDCKRYVDLDDSARGP